LRRKSQVELHALWHVMVRERNMLHSEKHAARRVQATMKDPSRIRKVRKSMARIKVVLGERSRAHHAAMAEAEAAGGAAAAAAGGAEQEASS
jgi:large subunit ribosomal protein L47